MKDFALYALEANIYLALFVALYFVAFRNTTNHMANRLFLMSSVLCSWLIPSLNFSSQITSVLPKFELGTITLSSGVNEGMIESNALPLEQFLPLVYLLGTIALTSILVFHAIRIIKIIRKGKKESRDGFGVVTTESSEAWSFFNFIVIGNRIPSENLEWIMAHEKVHAREAHTLDKLLVGGAKVLGWFNPAVYFLERAIEENHEFRADEVVCNSYSDQSTYSYVLLSQAIGGIGHGVLSHQFSKKSMLKSRIQMINTTKQTGKMKYLLTIPVLAVALLLHSCTKQDLNSVADEATEKSVTTDDSDQVFMVVEKMPEFEGGMDGLIEFMGENTVYPDEAKAAEDEGKVFVQFIIDENGNVTNPTVVEKSSVESSALRAAALETVSRMPAWSPGQQKGRNVKVQLTLPIKFELE